MSCEEKNAVLFDSKGKSLSVGHYNAVKTEQRLYGKVGNTEKNSYT